LKIEITIDLIMEQVNQWAASSLPSSEREAVCYLCLDAGPDEVDQPLRRDCACRGTDAGFVHVSCLANYAETKSKQASDTNAFSDQWIDCPNCHQQYQNELGIDIATKFVSFVRRQYPNDTKRQVESLYLKMRAFDSMLERLTVEQKREFGVTANVLLSLIDRMKGDASLSRRYFQMKADAYNAQGRIALDEESEESARRAVVHLKKAVEVFKAIGDADGAAIAKANIAHAKSLYEGGRNNEERLKVSQELYKLRVAEYGEEHEYTINSGKNYAISLREANHEGEARELLTKLLATSKQVFGPDHNITREVESTIKQTAEVA
jgi:hypothetical protein